MLFECGDATTCSYSYWQLVPLNRCSMSKGPIPKCREADLWNERERLNRRPRSIIGSRFQGQKIFNVEWTLVVRRLVKKGAIELNSERYWEPM